MPIRLGARLRSMQPAALFSLWDNNGDGYISLGEFVQHVRKMGFKHEQARTGPAYLQRIRVQHL